MLLFLVMLRLARYMERIMFDKILHLTGINKVFKNNLYLTDARIDDIKILHDSVHYIVVDKRYDVLINHEDKNLEGLLKRFIQVEQSVKWPTPDMEKLVKLKLLTLVCVHIISQPLRWKNK
jgi:hypothetical protein